MKRWIVAFAAIAVLTLSATPASAELWFVTLENGTSFETIQQPQEASFDRDTILILTEVGNWIGLQRENIESIVAQTEFSGYGKVIDSSTIFMGIAPNDLPFDDGEGEPESYSGTDRLVDYLESQGSSEPFSIEQFVGTDGTTGGLPVGLATAPTISFDSGNEQ